MDIAGTVLLIIIDICIVAGVSIGVGYTAPRWPSSWLQVIPRPLYQFPWESPAYFRRVKAGWWADRLPELGATFGGESKNDAPDRGAEQIRHYLVELRRAEWVHWISMVTWVPLAFFNPWWLTLPFAIIVMSGNSLYLLILRNNRLRLERILQRMTKGETT